MNEEFYMKMRLYVMTTSQSKNFNTDLFLLSLFCFFFVSFFQLYSTETNAIELKFFGYCERMHKCIAFAEIFFDFSLL